MSREGGLGLPHTTATLGHSVAVLKGTETDPMVGGCLKTGGVLSSIVCFSPHIGTCTASDKVLVGPE